MRHISHTVRLTEYLFCKWSVSAMLVNFVSQQVSNDAPLCGEAPVIMFIIIIIII
jgi:hypothetical protein